MYFVIENCNIKKICMGFIRLTFNYVIIIIVLSFNGVYSQSVEALKINEEITINGLLDEPVWNNAKAISDFTQFEPVYGQPASFQTEIKVLYDNQMIYFGIQCTDPDPTKISTKVTKRDGEVWEDDAIALVIDTFDDDNNAYFFIVNALGTQQDERWADNGRTRDTKFDVKWISAGAKNGEGWTAEIAIPFETVKFNRKTKNWGFDVIRYIPRNLEKSHWTKNLTQWNRISEIGSITGLDLMEARGKRITVIPYVQTQLQKGEKPTMEFGGDLRVNLSSNMSIDATINPDFATIEGDVEQVNLTRFELSYPEKRPFFMEGGENYSTRIKQFYSRRIGEIPWGIKFNGKINSWKINALTTQSDPSSVNPDIEPGDNATYSVFRVNKEIVNGSNIGLIGANRNFSDQNKGSVGLVTTLFFTKHLGMTSQLIKSYGDYNDGSWTYFIRPSIDTKTAHFHIRYTHVGENVRENMNDIGFIRDDDRREVDSNIKKQFWINKYGFEDITPSVNYNMYWSQLGVLRSWDLSNSLTVNFLKKWSLGIKYGEEFKRFEKDFRNTDYEGTIKYDNKRGNSITLLYGNGFNFDRDYNTLGGMLTLKLLEGWNLTYHIRGYWFTPDNDDDNAVIHYLRSTYYLNKDLYFKLFYQTRYDVTERMFDPQFDMNRETMQFVFVWRFLPPFGSIQLALQQGTTRVTDIVGHDRTIFTKLSWVF